MSYLTGKYNKEDIRDLALFLIYPILIFYLNRIPMFDEFWEIGWKLFLCNIIFYEAVLLLIFAISGSGSLSIRIELTLVWLLGIIDTYVYKFRHSYIRPTDFYSVGTAANVASNYDYMPDRRMVVSLVVMIVLFIAAGFCRLKAPGLSGGKKIWRVVSALVSVIVICGMTFLIQKDSVSEILEIYDTQFDARGMMKKDGMAVSFMNQMKFLSVNKPSGYDSNDVAELLSSYETDLSVPEDLPDIMVFMDEAFSDPAVDGEFSTNIDYMPFIHSLEEGEENTVTGYINTSVNGGNTPNTEFEFLTGNTMAFLPEGSIAYQQYIHNAIDSIPTYLKKAGYSTLATHPYKASGWDRPRVWPLLGFDELLFDDYFEGLNPGRVRNYVSDDAYFQAVADLTDEMSGKGPVFSFNVTMQNHSGYYKEEGYDNFETTVSVNGIDDMSVQAQRMNNYLSLVKYTDTALQNVINRYRDSDRKVMIVFFGDHQPDPTTFDIMWNENNKDRDALSPEDISNTYRVPFVIWANFDIEEKRDLEISVNYLGNLMLEEAGFDLYPYRAFLSDLSKEYPVVSAVRYVDSDGGSVMKEDWGDRLLEYQKMQYYEMFDDKDEY